MVCTNCFRNLCGNLTAANDNTPQQDRIIVATDDELRRKACLRRIAIVTTALKTSRKMSRREFLDWLAGTIYGFLEDESRCTTWPDGTPFVVDDCYIDDLFEPSGRWVSYLVGFDGEEPRQAPQQRVLKRLRAIDLAFKIAFPDIAKHFPR